MDFLSEFGLEKKYHKHSNVVSLNFCRIYLSTTVEYILTVAAVSFEFVPCFSAVGVVSWSRIFQRLETFLWTVGVVSLSRGGLRRIFRSFTCISTSAAVSFDCCHIFQLLAYISAIVVPSDY